MARSTQTTPSPGTQGGSGTKQRFTKPPQLVMYETSDDESSSMRSASEAPTASHATFSDVSMQESDNEIDGDLLQNDEHLDHEDDVYLQQIAQAALTASQTAAQGETTSTLSPRKGMRDRKSHRFEALFVILQDSTKRSDLLREEFSEFVPAKDRLLLPVPKRISKSFVKTRAAKFIDMYNLYVSTTRLRGNYNSLLHAFESFLQDLMDCFDHPKEVPGWNPFGALANFVEAGAVIRTPGVVQSCSRLTLGADWGLLSMDDEKRIGPVLLLRLHRLHHWRMAETDELLARWSDKFKSGSTCKTCNTDCWEIFLLTTLVSLKKEGTRYIDVETASDTSSESDGDEQDRDDYSDDDEHDHHQDRDSDASAMDADSDNMDGDDEGIDPRLVFASMPCDDTQEPPRLRSIGLLPRQRSLHNYGPNAYVLRIVSMDEFGCVAWKQRRINACPTCGYRFDGKDPEPSSRYARFIEHAVEVARAQISDLQEVIDLP